MFDTIYGMLKKIQKCKKTRKARNGKKSEMSPINNEALVKSTFRGRRGEVR